MVPNNDHIVIDYDDNKLYYAIRSDKEFKINEYDLNKERVTRVIEKQYRVVDKPMIMRMSGFSHTDSWLSVFNIKVDKDNRLWVFSGEDYPNSVEMVLGSDCYFQIFDSDGSYLGKVEVPTPPKDVNILFERDKLISYDSYESTLTIYNYKLNLK